VLGYMWTFLASHSLLFCIDHHRAGSILAPGEGFCSSARGWSCL